MLEMDWGIALMLEMEYQQMRFRKSRRKERDHLGELLVISLMIFKCSQ
jgi:hypothetical protein